MMNETECSWEPAHDTGIRLYGRCGRCGAGPMRLDPVAALDAIHVLLDGQEWSSDTLEDIGAIVRATGRKIRPPEGDDA